MKKAKTKLGASLRAARLQAGMNQADVAQRLSVAPATVSNWETGRSRPNDGQREELDTFLRAFDGVEAGTEPLVMSYSAWLARERNKREMTVYELAKKSGISEQAIYSIESGKSANPQTKTRVALGKALGEREPDDVASATVEAALIPDLGSLIDFDTSDAGTWPREPGVYVFYDISDRPIYVGKAANIKQRIGQHVEKFWFKPPIVERGSYIRIDDENLRSQVEKILIGFLKSNAVINRQLVVR
jgi:transcriptional regulator with XRE-family HTH domain